MGNSRPRRAAVSPARRRVGFVAVAAAFVLVAAIAVWAVVQGFAPVNDAGPEPGDAGLGQVVAALPPVTTDDMPANSLAIPSLRIKAPVINVTLTGNDLPVPPDEHLVGRTTTAAPLCAAQGTTLMAGHVSSYGTKGALYPLAATQPGTELVIACPDGHQVTYVAEAAPVTVHKGEVDPSLNTVDGPARVALITCGGPVMANGHYRDNVVALFTRKA